MLGYQLFDCRRGASEGVEKAWGEEDYGAALQQLQRWVTGIFRWTVIFLLPLGVSVDERVRQALHLPSECTWFRGVWVF
jgi:hypothetical protein